MTVRVKVDVVATAVFESVTFTVRFALPVEVGVPEITPVAVFKDNPVGNVPELIA